MPNHLTESEIYELTGAKRPSRQIEVLKKNGIPHIVRIDKKPFLTWDMVNSVAKPSSPQMPQIDTSWMQV